MLTSSSTTILSGMTDSGGGGSVLDQDAICASGCGVTVEEVGSLVLAGGGGGNGSPAEGFVPKRIVVHAGILAALSDDGNTLLLADFRSRQISGPNDGWSLKSKSFFNLCSGVNDVVNDKRYLDLALVPNTASANQTVLILLHEKVKNKERCLTAYHISTSANGRPDISEPFSTYDKVNVLGKGVSHIAAAPFPSNTSTLKSSATSAGDEIDSNGSGDDPPTIYAVSSNLVRKLRLEDQLKPTTARAQVPTDCTDGTLAVVVQPPTLGMCSGGRPSRTSMTASTTSLSTSASPSPFTSRTANVIVAFKTRSATGKNKYTIEYYNSKARGGDEIFNSKASVKLGDEAEPTVLMNDPRDSRIVYALCVNKTNGTTALHKISKGKRLAETPVLTTFNYEIRSAAMTVASNSNPGDKSIVLVAYDAIGDVARVYSIQKTEGFRGRHPLCSATTAGSCTSLDALSSPAHIVSCSATKWQLTQSQVEVVAPSGGHGVPCAPSVQMGLATLYADPTAEGPKAGRMVTEPETEVPYRIRFIGCGCGPTMNPVSVLIDDLEKVFDGEEHRLTNSVLKICLSHCPSRDNRDRLTSGLLMNGKIGAIELYHAAAASGNGELGGDPAADAGSSERFVVKPVSTEKFRSLVSDVDWTNLLSASPTHPSQQRQGTFTLEDQDNNCGSKRPQSAVALTRGTSPRSSGGSGGGGGGGVPGSACSRIPTPRASVERTPSSASSHGRPSGIMSTSMISSSEHFNGGGGSSGSGGSGGGSLAEVQRLKAVIRRLQNTLNVVLDADAAVRNNLHSMRQDVEEAVAQADAMCNTTAEH